MKGGNDEVHQGRKREKRRKKCVGVMDGVKSKER